ncbi:Holliday junction resolvase [Candidatus Mycoplasma haematobovis]|uniref:Holliday junction resolvase n=1 Tax=Candidatus Mycoplasma haematobovis TaxID=432608 RepID=A0A1A9QEH7_9MOLU|nr:Holliday junction resolvase RuvX [Candidatus Mycoplasma haematobovis]OAL10356.1 Holliday junction resolvase [Candidatus Mycoplasma haematobovis]
MRVLALDIGSKKTGIALSSLNQEIIFPLNKLVLKEFKGNLFFEMLKKQLNRVWEEIDTVVIGKVNQDNAIADLIDQVTRLLKAWTNWEVILISETNSTVDSRALLNRAGYRGKKKANKVDSYAALLFLFDFFKTEVLVNF